MLASLPVPLAAHNQLLDRALQAMTGILAEPSN
jgi:hypothetical protein